MGVPTPEVGYTTATPRREDHWVHKDMWWHWIKKNQICLTVRSQTWVSAGARQYQLVNTTGYACKLNWSCRLRGVIGSLWIVTHTGNKLRIGTVTSGMTRIKIQQYLCCVYKFRGFLQGTAARTIYKQNSINRKCVMYLCFVVRYPIAVKCSIKMKQCCSYNVLRSRVSYILKAYLSFT
jgi:hypothetical protein